MASVWKGCGPRPRVTRATTCPGSDLRLRQLPGRERDLVGFPPDWNHNDEKAVFFGVTRSQTIWWAPGWAAGISGAYGWDANNGDSSLEDGKEWAANF